MNAKNSQAIKLLAIDTALDNCSVSLTLGDKIFNEAVFAPKQHAQLILPMIENVLSSNNTNIKELDLLAFGAGPAGFTGTRIAAGIVQGLALGANLPVSPISTLQAMAQGAYREFAAKNVLVCLDARMQEIYWGVYQLGIDNIMQPVIKDQLSMPQDLPQLKKQTYLGIGNGWSVYKTVLEKTLNLYPYEVLANYSSDAQDIAYIAKKLFSAGIFFPAENATPSYLRGAGNWKKINEQS